MTQRNMAARWTAVLAVCAATGTAFGLPTHSWDGAPTPFAASWVGGGPAWVSGQDPVSGGEAMAGVLMISSGSTLSPGGSSDTLVFLGSSARTSTFDLALNLLGGGGILMMIGEGTIVLPSAVATIVAPRGTGVLHLGGGPDYPSGNDITLTVIPEPGTWAMLAVAGAAAILRRRNSF